MIEVARRAELIAAGAAEWRDPASAVREEARAALRGGPWSAPVVEAALDDVLWDLDETRARSSIAQCAPVDAKPVLVFLPGNVIGPAIAAAYCAAAAGASILMKPPGIERRLTGIVARQFDRIGPPIAGSLEERYWKGGDSGTESDLLERARRIVVFGTDATVDDLRRRAGVERVRAYGDSSSLGLVLRDADPAQAAAAAARDICMFDQRGCMSPQTIYVEGDDGKATLFGRALASALRTAGSSLPRGPVTRVEAEAAAMTVRRLAVTALPSKAHGLDTLILGPDIQGAPEFVVAIEPLGSPTREGFGRIVAVKACEDAGLLFDVLEDDRGATKETLGYAGALNADVRARLLDRHFSRVCPLGEMQRPPFGYRPAPLDFA
jgi:acyl-CoA reductase-like NAD-dependent aldehyde dehydrogenase